jgi:thioester reductase-like protein
MSYFVTGATGFVGRFLLAKLLARKGTVYVLARKASKTKIDELKERYPEHAARIVPVWGDLTKPKLGISADVQAELKGKIRHFFHLAAIYDLSADAESQKAANIDGTRNAVEFAEVIRVGCFHHTSSIAAAGLYSGMFREDMFEEAENLDHPYFRTKHDSEAIVRKECNRPFRIYRPAMVVGHSKTGEIDKIDGPYYFFTLLKRMRQMLPPWVPMLGFEGGRINLVPVDFVVDAAWTGNAFT